MHSRIGKIAATLGVVVIAGASYFVGTGLTITPRGVSAAPALFNEDAVTALYASVSPAVVEITVTSGGTYRMYGGETQGSGFLVDKQGDILTNAHVVSGGGTISVTLQSGTELAATLKGQDTADDLAVINVDASKVSDITPLAFGDSGALKIGQMALAVGSPYGQMNSLTVGVVSGLNRDAGTGTSAATYIQTDAALNPGNSGGPLLNSQGLVIGVNDAVENGADGMGYAIPANLAQSKLSALEAGQQITKPYIGITGATITAASAQSLGLSVSSGVYVVSVVSGSPAAAAGLKAGGADASGNLTAGGDVITAADGTAMNTINDLANYIAGKQVGDKVSLSVLRDGKTMTVQVTLAARPQNTPTPTPTRTS